MLDIYKILLRHTSSEVVEYKDNFIFVHQCLKNGKPAETGIKQWPENFGKGLAESDYHTHL